MTIDADIAKTRELALSADEFWALIDLLGGIANEDSTEVLSAELASGPAARILGFEASMTLALYELDTRATCDWLAEADPDGEELGISDDVFLYARCATVASGRAVWERSVANGTVESTEPVPADGEMLLYVTENAAAAADIEFDPEVIPLSYETGSNDAGWGRG